MEARDRLDLIEREIDALERSSQPGRAGAPGPSGRTAAGLLVRLAAAWLDAGVAVAGGLVAGLVVAVLIASGSPPDIPMWLGASGQALRTDLTSYAGVIDAVLLGAAAIAPLYGLGEAFTGWTLGKQLMGLTLASASDGEKLAVQQLALRYAIKYAPLLVTWVALFFSLWLAARIGPTIVVIGALGFSLAAGPSKRALHDRLCGTVVLRTHRLTRLAEPVARAEAPKTEDAKEPAAPAKKKPPTAENE